MTTPSHPPADWQDQPLCGLAPPNEAFYEACYIDNIYWNHDTFIRGFYLSKNELTAMYAWLMNRLNQPTELIGSRYWEYDARNNVKESYYGYVRKVYLAFQLEFEKQLSAKEGIVNPKGFFLIWQPKAVRKLILKAHQMILQDRDGWRAGQGDMAKVKIGWMGGKNHT